MKIIESELFKKFEGLHFGFSTKVGLGRRPPFHFNISKSVGDDEKIVESNRKALAEALEIDPDLIIYQKQVHSDIVKYVDSPGTAGECDAMITDKRNLFLAATSADCPTIYIYDRDKNIIAAVHSGWRGTAKNIVDKTVTTLKKDFHCEPDDLIAYIAPSICQESYEVGGEVVNRFEGRYVKEINGTYYLDLIGANLDMLKEQGIPEENIEVSSLCSFRESDLLHSYRREGVKSGRAFGILGMKG